MMKARRKTLRNKDKEAQEKKRLQEWQERYRQTELSEEELNELRANLSIKGVSMRRMNPKGLTIEELFGEFDKESRDWKEGLFTEQYRRFALQRDDRKKWILLDGPIDFMWVENLNSILDDNKRMSLPNGDQIKMSEGMCIVLEAEHLRNVTPATVSRCGLVSLHRSETCETKAIFNQWLRNLPANLTEYAKDLETSTNFLMVEAIAVYEKEASAGRISFKAADLHWLIQSFVRFLTTLIYDFYIDHERAQAANPAVVNPDDLNLAIGQIVLEPPEQVASADKNDPSAQESPAAPAQESASRQGSKHQDTRVKTPDSKQRETEKGKRLANCNFLESDIRLENALNQTPAWLESFVVFAMVWTFYPVLSPNGRKELDARLQNKYEQARMDFNSYKKEKKRQLAEKTRDTRAAVVKPGNATKGKSDGRASGMTPNKSAVSGQSPMSVVPETGRQKKKEIKYSKDGYSMTWEDELEDKPMLISDFPENQSFYDYFFNLDSSKWNPFSLEMALNEAQIDYASWVPSEKKIQNVFVPSTDTIRYAYILESLITNQTSALVVGPACSGRSSLVRSLLFRSVFDFTRQLITDHITMSNHYDSGKFKECVERLLEVKLNK